MSDLDDLRAAVRAFGHRLEQSGQTATWDRAVWRQLAELGVLGLGDPDSGAGLREIAAAFESLGAVGCPGPLVDALVAARALDPPARAAAVSGEIVVTCSADLGVVAWGPEVDTVLNLADDGTVRTCSVGAQRTALSTAGDAWWVATVTPDETAGMFPEIVRVVEVALAAYLVGAGIRMVDLAAEYAAGRRQFGQAIGNFQAVSHPLAASYAALVGARDLLAAAAAADTRAHTAAARIAAVEANADAASVAMQAHGGMGFVDDTVLSRLVRRSAQIAPSCLPLAASEAAAVPAPR